MAQEDKGLVLRGMFLLVVIGVLVTFVLAMIFWRQPLPPVSREKGPEYFVAQLVAPPGEPFPSHVWWGTIIKLGQTLPSEPGWEIRYNAAATLARRGSANVPWPILREMLDEDQQRRNHGARLPDGQYVYDEVAARAFTVIALKAIAGWHEKHPKGMARPKALDEIYQRVDELAQSPHQELKTHAEKTRSTFIR